MSLIICCTCLGQLRHWLSSCYLCSHTGFLTSIQSLVSESRKSPLISILVVRYITKYVVLTTFVYKVQRACVSLSNILQTRRDSGQVAKQSACWDQRCRHKPIVNQSAHIVHASLGLLQARLQSINAACRRNVSTWQATDQRAVNAVDCLDSCCEIPSCAPAQCFDI